METKKSWTSSYVQLQEVGRPTTGYAGSPQFWLVGQTHLSHLINCVTFSVFIFLLSSCHRTTEPQKCPKVSNRRDPRLVPPQKRKYQLPGRQPARMLRREASEIFADRAACSIQCFPEHGFSDIDFMRLDGCISGVGVDGG